MRGRNETLAQSRLPAATIFLSGGGPPTRAEAHPMSDSDVADEVRRLRAELDEMKQLLRESGRGLSRPTRAPLAAIDTDDGTVRSDSESDSESDSDAGSVSRRHALHTAGAIVAGALAGGIATVATAGPAAAASGTFDGAPAVRATFWNCGPSHHRLRRCHSCHVNGWPRHLQLRRFCWRAVQWRIWGGSERRSRSNLAHTVG